MKKKPKPDRLAARSKSQARPLDESKLTKQYPFALKRGQQKVRLPA
jgi:hypothetical protein